MEGDRYNLTSAMQYAISIHSLRMEGDRNRNLCKFLIRVISIHSLRMEGDSLISTIPDDETLFQSTPSAWRETQFENFRAVDLVISIHSLRMEGDIYHRSPDRV